MRTVFVLGEYGPGGQYHPTADIRLLRPLRHPSLAASLDVRDGLRVPAEHVDTIILERFWHTDITVAAAEEVVRQIRRRSSHFLYEIDDNLLDLGSDESGTNAIAVERQAVVRYFLRHADGVIACTPPLAERLNALHDRVVVVPNALDEQLFPDVRERLEARSDTPPTGPMVFGYMGTATHTSDLMMVLEPLRSVLRKYRGDVEFQLAEVTKDERVRKALDGLPVKPLTGPVSTQYRDYVPWAIANLRWDFGIAPLADTALNRCKSDIKYLDYAVLGIPGIFSRCDAFDTTVDHGTTGLLCGPEPEEWHLALERMMTQAHLRSRLALAAHDSVRPARLLATKASDWLTAIEALCQA